MTPSPTPTSTCWRRIAVAVALAATMTACSVARNQETVGSYVDDTTITAEIKARMASDKDVAATSIGVETMSGVTQLSGFAKSQAEKERASEIARQVKGVRAVRNDIIVRTSQQ